MNPKDAARDANIAANDAVKAAKLTHKAASEVVAAKQDIDTRFPTDHELMVRALASQEQAAALRLGPKRNRWKELEEYEARLVEIEQRRAALLEEIGALNLQINKEPQRHTAALATWMEEGEKGERPASKLPELQSALADRQAEYDALGERYNRVLTQRPSTSSRTVAASAVMFARPRRRPPKSIAGWSTSSRPPARRFSTFALRSFGSASSRPSSFSSSQILSPS